MGGGTADIATSPWTRLVIAFGLAAAVAVAAVALVAGTDDGDEVDEGPSPYDLEVVLGGDQPLTAVWSSTVNGHGVVATAVARGADRPLPRILLTDGRNPAQDLGGDALARSATVPGIAIDRRSNVLAIDEFASGDFTRRRAALWSPRAPGQPTVLVEGAWSVAGEPAADTSHVPGRRPAMSAMGPGVAVIDIRDGTDRAQHRVLDATGEVSEVLAEGPLEAEPVRPSASADGSLVLSTGDEIVAMEPGIQRTLTIVSRADGFARLGAEPAASQDGRLIVFAADRGTGPALYATRRTDDGGWTDPVRLDGPEPESIDEPLAATSIRHPPEVGDVGVVAFRGPGGPATRSADGDGGSAGSVTTLWVLVLADRPSTTRAVEVTAVRPVVRLGDRLSEREVTAIHPQPALVAPAERTGAADDHWLAFGLDTDEGGLVVRASPVGSGLRDHVTELTEHPPH